MSNLIIISGTEFSSLESESGEYLLTLEKNDPLLYGHLVLYHVIDKNEIEKNIQLWNSDYTKNGSQAMIDVSTPIQTLSKSLLSL